MRDEPVAQRHCGPVYSRAESRAPRVVRAPAPSAAPHRPGCLAAAGLKVTGRSRTELENRTSLSFPGSETPWQDVPFTNAGETAALNCVGMGYQGCLWDMRMERCGSEQGVVFILNETKCLSIYFEGKGQVLNQ